MYKTRKLTKIHSSNFGLIENIKDLLAVSKKLTTPIWFILLKMGRKRKYLLRFATFKESMDFYSKLRRKKIKVGG